MPDLGWKEHHVQNHSVIGPVQGVAVGDPIRSTQVKFDIARELRAVAQPYPGATKIRAAEQIPFSGVPDV
jgi:hypothetical protein